MNKQKAIEAFRKVAQEYFDTTNKHRKINLSGDYRFYNGICYALNRITGCDGYLLMNFCLDELKFPNGELDIHYNENQYVSDWEDRAYMCLLVAELLEDGTIKFSKFKNF